jgi:hypothetical protein
LKDPTGAGLAGRTLFNAAAQILKNLLLALLHFKKNWLGKSQVVLRRMNLASLQKNGPEVGDALLGD